MHDVIQSEKNKCINLVNAAQQKISDIKNQTKLLGNEIANLRNIIMTKERWVLSKLRVTIYWCKIRKNLKR